MAAATNRKIVRRKRASSAASSPNALGNRSSDEQKRLYIDHQFDAAPDTETAVKRVVLLVLLSPRFLYREIGGAPEAYNVAARLSFALWDSLPDDELLSAAASGKLATREQVAKQAERMLADPRAHTKVRQFLGNG